MSRRKGSLKVVLKYPFVFIVPCLDESLMTGGAEILTLDAGSPDLGDRGFTQRG